MMTDVETIVAEKLAEMSSSGKIRELVEANVEKAVTEAIGSAFRTYGKAGEQLRETVEAALCVKSHIISIDAYHLLVQEIVGNATRDFLLGDARQRYADMLAEMFEAPPKETTVQAIIDPWLEDWRNDPSSIDHAETAYIRISESCSGYFREFKLFAQDPDGGGRTYSKPSPELEFYCCKDGRFSVPRSMIYGARSSPDFKLDTRVFQMFAAGTKITDAWTVDADDLDLSILGR